MGIIALKTIPAISKQHHLSNARFKKTEPAADATYGINSKAAAGAGFDAIDEYE